MPTLCGPPRLWPPFIVDDLCRAGSVNPVGHPACRVVRLLRTAAIKLLPNRRVGLSDGLPSGRHSGHFGSEYQIARLHICFRCSRIVPVGLERQFAPRSTLLESEVTALECATPAFFCGWVSLRPQNFENECLTKCESLRIAEA